MTKGPGIWRLDAGGSDIRIRTASLAALGIVLITSGGCSSQGATVDARVDMTTNDVPAADGAGDPVDIRRDDASDASRDDALDSRTSDVADGHLDDSCRLPLDAAQPFVSCLPTFDDDGWSAMPCSFFQPGITERMCTGYRSRRFDYGTHSWTCYYDLGTGVLVAGVFVDDINSFCGGSAYIVTLGDVPLAGTCAAPTTFSEPCVSTDAGSGNDASSQ